MRLLNPCTGSLFNECSDRTASCVQECRTGSTARVEKGWGDLTAGTLDADEVLNKEEEKMWQTIREVAPDMHVFDVLSLPKLYHNLKAAIKEVCTEVENKTFLR